MRARWATGSPGRGRPTGRDWDNPFAGYGPAHGEDLSHGGMGLWLARQLCDHVVIRHTPDGTAVRLTIGWD
jgi:anti-sigma regulatory factor (Ser/Thr protein kinase)